MGIMSLTNIKNNNNDSYGFTSIKKQKKSRCDFF